MSQQQLESGLSAGEQGNVRGQLATEIRDLRNQIASLEEQQRALEQEESQLRASLSQMADANLQHSDIQRELTLAEESLERFLQRKQELKAQQLRGNKLGMCWRLHPCRRSQCPNRSSAGCCWPCWQG